MYLTIYNNNINNKLIERSHDGKVTILWNREVQTDRTIPNNKQDIIIRDNLKGTCMLIDVAISGDKNVIKKEAEKDFKIQRPYKMNIAHLGCKNESDTSNDRGNFTISKSFRKCLSNAPKKHEIKELRKQPHWALRTYCGNY